MAVNNSDENRLPEGTRWEIAFRNLGTLMWWDRVQIAGTAPDHSGICWTTEYVGCIYVDSRLCLLTLQSVSD